MGLTMFRSALRSRRVLAIALLAVASVTAAGLSLGMREGYAAPQSPPWRGDPGECRQDPMTHVHRPTRLDLLGPCASVSGIVQKVFLDTAYNDLKIVIVPDPDYRRYLWPANHGELIADVIATDLLRVPVPAVGSRIIASGAWVLDRAKDTVALHPTYSIQITEGEKRATGLPGDPKRRGGQLALQVHAPETVAVGEEVDITIRSDWINQGQRQPASEIRLFTELTDATGTGVRWRATRTNGLGTTTVRVPALHVPGNYTLTIYATPSGYDTTASAQLRITRPRP